MTDFIAIDGEADDDGNYIILCDSTGRTLYDPNGIRSADALDFLLTLPARHEIVCFGLNYDANQWLRELPRPALERLATDNRCAWNGDYKLEWIPSKSFTVTVPGRSVTVCEVFGFFQTSFVKALQNWGFDPPAEIERMKRKRGTFTRAELQRVIAYCHAECDLLVQLMNKLQDACKRADCVPRRRWIGAGSIASSLLTSHHARDHHAYDVDLFGQTDTEDYVLRAYFGGRVELFAQGYARNVMSSDVRSAYPSAALHLPSLSSATVSRARTYAPDEPYALWRVRWQLPATVTVAPFPTRLPGGQICWPLAGSGVYHAAEVRAAIGLYGAAIEVIDGLVIRSGDETPFDWITEVYEHRKRFKAERNHAEKALKLGMNSIYGKMAQGYGFGKRPPFQSYFWAGFITSHTRAQMLRKLAASTDPIMAATDGIVATKTPHDNISDELGAWEVGSYDLIGTVQPGVYVVKHDGETFTKSRGFLARDVDYPAMLDLFTRDGPQGAYHYQTRRFIGLKVALHRTDFNVWRKWIVETRAVAFENTHKLAGAGGVLYPPPGPHESLPYTPKQSLWDDPTDTLLESAIADDQPHMGD